MEKFENVVMKLAGTLPNGPIPPPTRALLRDRLSQFVSQYKTPDHPPYSAMIEKAIRELDEKKGSTEVSISHLLEKEYSNLPWAHTTILKHHLEKLCVSGDIVLTRNRYKLPGEIPIPNPPNTKVKKSPPKKKRMFKWDWEKEKRRRLRKKKKLAMLRLQQRSKKAKAVKKHQEQDESGGKLIEENGGNPVSKDITILPTQGKQDVQECDRKEQLIGDNGQNPVSSDITTLMTPVFNQQQLEISKPGLAELEDEMSLKDLFDSERARRQAKRWNQSSPEFKAAVSVGSVELVTSNGPKEKQSLAPRRLNLEMQTDPNPGQTKGSVPVKVDEVYYTRRRKLTLGSSSPEVGLLNGKGDCPNVPVALSPLSNGKGAQKLPPPQTKVEEPRRSTRLMTSAKPGVNEDTDYYVIALPAQNCPKMNPLEEKAPVEAPPKCSGRRKPGKVKA